MEIRRAHLCDFFLVLLFYDIFMYKIMCCKQNISTTTTTKEMVICYILSFNVSVGNVSD